MYAKLEENHGLARHAMAVYERSTKAVLPEEQFEVRILSSLVAFILCMFFFYFKAYTVLTLREGRSEEY